MSKTVVAWEADDLRIVVVENYKDQGPLIVLERCERDALGARAWMTMSLPEDATSAAAVLRVVFDLLRRNDMLPLWARKVVDDEIAHYRTHVDGGDGGSAA